MDEKLKNSIIPIPEKTRKKILEEIEKDARDTTKTTDVDKSGNVNLSFGGDTRLDKFIKYQKKYPDSKIDVALDTLG